MSKDKYALIKNEIAEFYDRLRTKMEYIDVVGEDLDQVYQINIQAFPLSKRVER